ncbi:MAG: proline dehydrogenase family protein [Bacteroidales bacterium]|nr:proline dehydrogenase family protein [Bacteroidales bacterium]MCF8405285.1 proline dehydrogenase family protein [Bacteroidales bacterium]
MLSFESTEIAFISKTDKDLKRAKFLFSMIGSNAIVFFGKLFSRIALKFKFPVAWAVKPTIYKHFVGGETIDDCQENVRLLEKFNVRAILDYSVEGTESIEAINIAMEETLKTIDNAAHDENVPFAVFKPTAFTHEIVLKKKSAGESLNPEEEKEADNFRERVKILCQTAYENNVPILIDAEDVAFQNFIDEVVYENMAHFNKDKAIVFNTYQMYRHDRLKKLEEAYNAATEKGYFLGAKFVRGAYMEKERARAEQMGYPDPIQPDKESTDRDYNAALKFCIEHIDRISVFNGTHNEYSSKFMVELMEQHGLAKDDPRCWFSQLFGMSDHISFNLANQGYNVAKYLPFGPVRSVLPYLIRRTEENTSIAGQTSRELAMVKKEIERRKNKS